MTSRHFTPALAIAGLFLSLQPATAESTLRIAMTAADIPTTTGLPNNGFEGMRFLGYPIFEGLVLWDLTKTTELAGLRPGLAEKWEQDPNDSKTWIFHLRHGVKFHDGDFNQMRWRGISSLFRRKVRNSSRRPRATRACASARRLQEIDDDTVAIDDAGVLLPIYGGLC